MFFYCIFQYILHIYSANTDFFCFFWAKKARLNQSGRSEILVSKVEKTVRIPNDEEEYPRSNQEHDCQPNFAPVNFRRRCPASHIALRIPVPRVVVVRHRTLCFCENCPMVIYIFNTMSRQTSITLLLNNSAFFTPFFSKNSVLLRKKSRTDTAGKGLTNGLRSLLDDQPEQALRRDAEGDKKGKLLPRHSENGVFHRTIFI